MEFNFVHLRIHITTRDATRLVPFLYGSGPAFAAAFRHTVCRNCGLDCPPCRDLPACPYQRLFGQQLAIDPAALKRYQKPPLPFIFSFPSPVDTRHQVHDIACELVLVGDAIHYIADFIAALHSLLALNQGDALPESRISVVESLDYQRNAVVIATGSPVPDGSRVITLDAAGVVKGRNLCGDMLGIRFLTPLWLVKDGRQMRVFDASQFVRSLMRRVSSLAYYYCGLEMDDNFRSCADAADRLDILEAHFSYGKYGARAGVMGEGCLSGDFSDLMVFLTMGEYLHLGKGAAFGMGSYRLFEV